MGPVLGDLGPIPGSFWGLFRGLWDKLMKFGASFRGFGANFGGFVAKWRRHVTAAISGWGLRATRVSHMSHVSHVSHMSPLSGGPVLGGVPLISTNETFGTNSTIFGASPADFGASLVVHLGPSQTHPKSPHFTF